MGWKNDLQQASFRGVEFECISTKDSVNRSLAIHQAPYSNKAQIEDLGSDSRKTGLRIFLEGSDYKLYLDALEVAFNLTGAGELIHPIYGIKNVYVANYEIGHDVELVDGCYIDADFVTSEFVEKPLFIPVRLPERIEYAMVVVDPALAMQQHLEQLKLKDPNAFLTLVNRVRNGLQKARKILGIVRSTIDNILSPPEWAMGLVDDISRLVNFDVTNISALSKWRGLVSQVRRIGDIFDDDHSSADPQELKQLWRAVTVAAVVGTAQTVVDNVRIEMAQNNNNASLTPPELGIIRKQVRQDIQAVILIERNISQSEAIVANIDPISQVALYKTIADQVHNTIQALIETRPPLIIQQVALPCTLHLLAHQLYGDMTRANELKRLNPTLQNPSAILAGTELTAYAR